MKKNHQTSFEIIFESIEELQPLTIIFGTFILSNGNEH